MNKLITKILLGVFAVFLFAGSSFAATSVRLQQPKTPTNLDTFNITFVALDTKETPISVQCFKKGPSDGAFSAFGGAIALSNGGNTDVCQVTSGVVNTNGTYQFYVEATGEEVVQSNTVNVDFNNSTPGTPTNYSKERFTECIYRIHFRSADDAGKTVKVNLYRSDNTTFSVDNGHLVGGLDIGSNTDGVIENNVPDCNKTWYFVIRAFDTFGNGSGVVGDSNVTTVNVVNTSNPAQVAQGAIQVGGTGGQVLGDETNVNGEEKGEVKGSETKNGEVKGDESILNGNNPVANLTNWALQHKGLVLVILLLIGAISYYLYRKYKK